MEAREFGPKEPPVRVEPVTVQEGKVLIGNMPHDMQGGADLPHLVALDVEAWLQTPGRSAYHLTWEGSKIPREAEIAGRRVQNASNGYIAADPWGDELIGTYARIEREDRNHPKQQEMIVYVPAPEEELEIR